MAAIRLRSKHTHYPMFGSQKTIKNSGAGANLTRCRRVRGQRGAARASSASPSESMQKGPLLLPSQSAAHSRRVKYAACYLRLQNCRAGGWLAWLKGFFVNGAGCANCLRRWMPASVVEAFALAAVDGNELPVEEEPCMCQA